MFAEDIDLNDTTLYFQSVTVEGTTITAQTAGCARVFSAVVIAQLFSPRRQGD